MKKRVGVLLLFIIIISSFAFGGCEKESGFAVCSFGANNMPNRIELNNNMIEDPGIPVRDDGAVFEGWYYALNFDEENKVDFSKEVINTGAIFAKYDKCYCFSLRYGVLGCYGVEDPYYAIDYSWDKDVYIDYFIPVGTYKVTFTNYSSAKIGSVMIYKNDEYTRKDGYRYLRQNDYTKYGEEQQIVVTENEHVFVTANTVFLFQRTDVDSKYSEYSI